MHAAARVRPSMPRGDDERSDRSRNRDGSQRTERKTEDDDPQHKCQNSAADALVRDSGAEYNPRVEMSKSPQLKLQTGRAAPRRLTGNHGRP